MSTVWMGWKWVKDAANWEHFVDLFLWQLETDFGKVQGGPEAQEKKRRKKSSPPSLSSSSFPPPSSCNIPSLNGVCLPDLPRMKCHISDWSLSLNRFLCLPWFPRPSLTSLLGHWPLMCQPQLGTMGVGYLWSVHVYVCMCVCFEVAVWFCSELTKAPEVIKILWWGRSPAGFKVVLDWGLGLLWLCKVKNK